MEVRMRECSTAASPSRLPGLDWAVNPYRGCSHGCAYCYAQDVTRFEMRSPWGSIVEVKTNIVQKLKKQLARRRDGVYGVGTVTDPYQPLEEKHELTRGCLSVLRRHDARASILTKSDLVLRDLDLLEGWPGVEIGLTVGIVDEGAASVLEPGAPSPEARFEALRRLKDAGVDVYLMAAPMVPEVSDSEQGVHRLVELAHSSGVRRIIWDGFNPKPIARKRLEAALSAMGKALPVDSGRSELPRVAALMRSECARRRMELVDAF